MSDIVSQAKTSATGTHWEEKDLYWGSWETDLRSTATVLDAFAILDPKNQLAPNVVRWLMNCARRRPLALDAGDRVDVDRFHRLDEGHRRTHARLFVGAEVE